MKFEISFSTIREYSRIFWRIAGIRLPIFIILSFIQSFLEGFSLVMILPVISTLIKETADNAISKYVDRLFILFDIEKSFNNILIIMTFSLTLATIAKVVQNLFRIYIRTSITRDYQARLMNLYQGLDYYQFTKYSTGYLNNLVTTETGKAIGAFSNYCLVVGNTIGIIIYMIGAFLLSWQLTLLGLVSAIAVTLAVKPLLQKTAQYSLKISQNNAMLQEHLIQTIQSFKYLKATGRFSKMKNKVVEVVRHLIHLERMEGVVNWSYRGCLELYTYYLVIIILAYHVSIRGNSVASVPILAMFFYKTFSKTNALQISWREFLSNIGSLIIVEDAYKNITEQTEHSGEKEINSFNDNIALNNVSFSYNNNNVLKDINIEIPKNSTVAIVGESGAGKSTLIDIITGLLKPKTGTISIDGMDYSKISNSSFRNLIGFVPQDIAVFNDTVANNISFWSRKDDDYAKIINSAENAHCSEFIENMENKYETRIGDRGIKLSGGQKQRLAIARELFKEPEILIFDEATSSLDSKNESFIQQSINELKYKKTIIIIAHRLSTIKSCDSILVLDKGKIVEQGSFSELYEDKDSKFRKMCELQSL